MRVLTLILKVNAISTIISPFYGYGHHCPFEISLVLNEMLLAEKH